MSDVFLNGRIIGEVKEPEKFAEELRNMRRRNKITSNINVAYDSELDRVVVLTEKGRARRPLIVVKEGKSLFTREVENNLRNGKITWKDLISQGIVEFLDAEEEEEAYIAFKESELTSEHTHLEIIPIAIF